MTEAAASTHRWRRVLAVGALAVPLLAALWSGFPLCPSAGLFGLPCPGCGLTRATLALLQGDFHAAYHLHPLVLPLSPLYFGGMAAVLVDFVRGPVARPSSAVGASWLTRRWVTTLALVLLLSTLTLWVLRFVGYFGGPVHVESYRSWAFTHGSL